MVTIACILKLFLLTWPRVLGIFRRCPVDTPWFGVSFQISLLLWPTVLSSQWIFSLFHKTYARTSSTKISGKNISVMSEEVWLCVDFMWISDICRWSTLRRSDWRLAFHYEKFDDWKRSWQSVTRLIFSDYGHFVKIGMFSDIFQTFLRRSEQTRKNRCLT